MTPLQDNFFDNPLFLCACDATQQAARIQQQFYQQSFDINTKSAETDLVTQVDIACDKVISETLKAADPTALIITEETPLSWQTGFNLSNTWVVDPLDGTMNFTHGFPHFAVSIAKYVDGQALLAVVFDTMKQEWFVALKGQGAFCAKGNIFSAALPPTRLVLTSNDTLDKSLLGTGFPAKRHEIFEKNAAHFIDLMKHCHGVRRAGSAALDLAYVAAGRLNGFWEYDLSPWDVAAGALLVEEAGGCVSDLVTTRALNIAQQSVDILAVSGTGLEKQMRETLAFA